MYSRCLTSLPPLLFFGSCLLGWGISPQAKGADRVIRVAEHPEYLSIFINNEQIAKFVFKDKQVQRPFFANLRTMAGRQVTRNYPPVEGTDAMDHADMHPGVWLAFGDINRVDFWRNQGKMVHVEFLQTPHIDKNQLTFSTRCELRDASGKVLGHLDSDFELIDQTDSWMLIWRASIKAIGVDLKLGDQEEMGFGCRVATSMTEKNQGTIVNSKAKISAREVWGQPADWCDYSGVVDGWPAGITLMASPGNIGGSWWHARDYGLLVANPFGRHAMKQGEVSTVTIPAGQALALTFAASIHDDLAYEPTVAYQRFVVETK